MSGHVHELGLDLLCLSGLRHVTEAPHAADRGTFDALRAGVALEDASVLELDDVVALGLGVRIHVAHAAQEALGLRELVDHEPEGEVVVAGGHDLRRQAPHLDEPLVEPNDPAMPVDDDDPVGGGVERGLEQRKRLGQLALGDLPLPDHRRHDEHRHADRAGQRLDELHRLGRGHARDHDRAVHCAPDGEGGDDEVGDGGPASAEPERGPHEEREQHVGVVPAVAGEQHAASQREDEPQRQRLEAHTAPDRRHVPRQKGEQQRGHDHDAHPVAEPPQQPGLAVGMDVDLAAEPQRAGADGRGHGRAHNGAEHDQR